MTVLSKTKLSVAQIVLALALKLEKDHHYLPAPGLGKKPFWRAVMWLAEFKPEGKGCVRAVRDEIREMFDVGRAGTARFLAIKKEYRKEAEAILSNVSTAILMVETRLSITQDPSVSEALVHIAPERKAKPVFVRKDDKTFARR